ncbi:hypothetical protein ACA910_016871 [Epithemia clementina (nom. ined.)]
MSRLVILYGKGGLSDVGRHAMQVALEEGSAVESIKVLSRYPDLLREDNWNCSCPNPHSYPTDPKVEVVKIDSWKTDRIDQYLADATAIISCLGNRQPELSKAWESEEGNKALLQALPKGKKCRVVIMTSVGVEEDWPPMEFIGFVKIILSIMFILPCISRGAYRDLTQMERAYRATAPEDVDFLLVRPVGLGEDVKPVGKWWLQKEKYKDAVGGNMAKLDCARFMVQEALNPTKHREAVVIGSDPAIPMW